MEKAVSTLTRRNLLLAFAGGTAIAGISALLPFGSSTGSGLARRLASGNRWTRRFVSLGAADIEEWTAQVGSAFRVAGGWSLRLAGVRPLPSGGERPAGVRERAFAAVFDVVGGGDMPADLIYRVRPRDYAGFDMFLEAVEGGAGRRMIAVFN